MNSGIQILIIIAAVLAAAVFIGIRQRRAQRASLRASLEEQFGRTPDKRLSPERYANISGYYLHHLPEDGIDDITWNDLDMDAVFQRIDSTQSAAGEEYLYALLRSPSDGNPPEAGSATSNRDGKKSANPSAGSGESSEKNTSAGYREASPAAVRYEEIAHFRDRNSSRERTDLQMALHRLGTPGRFSMYDFIDPLSKAVPDSNLRHLPAFLLPAVSIVILFLNVPAGILCLIISMIVNMASYYHFRAKAAPYIPGLAYLLRMMRCADEILAVEGEESRSNLTAEERNFSAAGQNDLCASDALSADYARLEALQKRFAGLRRGSGILVSGSSASGGNPVDFILDYIRILFHIDLIRFNSMLTDVQAHMKEIDEELSILGRIDAAISLASFAESLPYTCTPVLQPWKKDRTQTIPADPLFSADGLYHPLLKKPVPNCLETDRSVLVTGSNASGKSTFLKSVALCALFAQTIGFCPAKAFHGTWFRIRSSMALRDNILNGESYFMVEIRSLKRIADLAGDGGRPVLCCIDEVLRGTNTIERIASSSVILRTLAEQGVLVFAATHDIELSGLLDGIFRNVHFEEEMGDRDVFFSYLLQEGPAVSRNAIRLLASTGFDPSVTAEAETMAEQFEQSGHWEWTEQMKAGSTE